MALLKIGTDSFKSQDFSILQVIELRSLPTMGG